MIMVLAVELIILMDMIDVVVCKDKRKMVDMLDDCDNSGRGKGFHSRQFMLILTKEAHTVSNNNSLL